MSKSIFKINQIKNMSKYIFICLSDFILIPFTFLAAVWFRLLRKHNIGFFGTISPFSKIIFQKVGVFPIIDNYYEPYFSRTKSKILQRKDRFLPGINFNIEKQLEFLEKFNFNLELEEISNFEKSDQNYSFQNGPFLSGDSEILFNIIRLIYPKKIIEIGCGHSSLMIQHAINFNKKSNKEYNCEHICIDPYESDWVEKLNVKFIKKKVEELDLSYFKSLESGDILFIDSSHIIRPHGDVLFEFLEILPILEIGVIVHIHDIFSPKEYLDKWVNDGVNFWNEQFLLEAFLSCNTKFEVICSVNYLKHNHYEKLLSKCPLLTKEREPGSFWIKRIA
jgi:hypothetical protein